MPRYLIEAKYTQSGAAGLARAGGTSRKQAVTAAAESVGGRVEAFYFAFGDADAIVIAEIPDNASAAAIALAVNQSGAATVKTTVLITPEEMDEAARRSVAYRAPGQ